MSYLTSLPTGLNCRPVSYLTLPLAVLTCIWICMFPHTRVRMFPWKLIIKGERKQVPQPSLWEDTLI